MSDDQPNPTPKEWREILMSRPDPLDGPGIGVWGGYSLAAECTAKAMLILADERPELLDVTAEKERDPTGWEASNNDKLWDACKERWPGLDEWLGGITGFQYGWAHNIVRHVKGVDATGNPAIMTVGIPTGEPSGD